MNVGLEDKLQELFQIIWIGPQKQTPWQVGKENLDTVREIYISTKRNSETSAEILAERNIKALIKKPSRMEGPNT